MNTKENNTNQGINNSELFKVCIIRALKSPSNWLLIVLTYVIWSLVGMRYSTNQNFNMVVAPQNYIMLLSLVSIVTALMNYTTKLIKLAFIGSLTFVISLVTVVVSQVGIEWLGYPIGYYLLCPISLFLFLLQVKQISCFSWCKYCEILKSGGKV